MLFFLIYLFEFSLTTETRENNSIAVINNTTPINTVDAPIVVRFVFSLPIST